MLLRPFNMVLNLVSTSSGEIQVAIYRAEVSFRTEPHDLTTVGLGYTFIHAIRAPLEFQTLRVFSKSARLTVYRNTAGKQAAPLTHTTCSH